MRLSEQPWWTDADAAETDLLAHELCHSVAAHRAKCAVCAAGHPPCPVVVEAIGEVLAWRAGRMLRSRAHWLRYAQTAAESEQIRRAA